MFLPGVWAYARNGIKTIKLKWGQPQWHNSFPPGITSPLEFQPGDCMTSWLLQRCTVLHEIPAGKIQTLQWLHFSTGWDNEIQGMAFLRSTIIRAHCVRTTPMASSKLDWNLQNWRLKFTELEIETYRTADLNLQNWRLKLTELQIETYRTGDWNLQNWRLKLTELEIEAGRSFRRPQSQCVDVVVGVPWHWAVVRHREYNLQQFATITSPF